MVNFKMTDNDYTEQSKYFEEGVHKVKIAGAIMDKMDDGREYVEIGVSEDTQQRVRPDVLCTGSP